MIVRLLPTQVPKFWDLVKPAVIEVGGRLAPGDWNLSNNALQLCLAGMLQVWLLSEGEKAADFKGVIITSITKEDVSKIRALTLWLLFFYRTPSIELIREAKRSLTAYAKENKCPTLMLHQLHDVSDKKVVQWWEGKWTKRAIYTLYYD